MFIKTIDGVIVGVFIIYIEIVFDPMAVFFKKKRSSTL